MYELALFAGAGGGILGGKLCGLTTVGAVEIDPWCTGVLVQRQNEGYLPPFPIWDDVRTFRADNPECADYIGFLRSIRNDLLISGGFPCQDISSAGRGEGLNGAKSGLWFEFARIICEVRPGIIFVENSPRLTVRGIHTVLGQMAEMGYHAAWGVLGADDVGANHYRKRIWIVAHAHRSGCPRPRLAQPAQRHAQTIPAGSGHDTDANGSARWPGNKTGMALDRQVLQKAQRGQSSNQPEPVCRDIPNANSIGRKILHGQTATAEYPNEACADVSEAYSEGFKIRHEQQHIKPKIATIECYRWWQAEPKVGRMADGLANRVVQLRAIGNGQVPGVAAEAFKYLNQILSSYDNGTQSR